MAARNSDITIYIGTKCVNSWRRSNNYMAYFLLAVLRTKAIPSLHSIGHVYLPITFKHLWHHLHHLDRGIPFSRDHRLLDVLHFLRWSIHPSSVFVPRMDEVQQYVGRTHGAHPEHELGRVRHGVSYRAYLTWWDGAVQILDGVECDGADSCLSGWSQQQERPWNEWKRCFRNVIIGTGCWMKFLFEWSSWRLKANQQIRRTQILQEQYERKGFGLDSNWVMFAMPFCRLRP